VFRFLSSPITISPYILKRGGGKGGGGLKEEEVHKKGLCEMHYIYYKFKNFTVLQF